jgi:hypothetical protein
VTRSGLFEQSLASKNLLGDDSGNSHHGGTAVVELSVLLADLLCWFLLPVVDLSEPDAVVAIKLGCGPPSKLDESHNDKDLSKSGGWDLEKSTDSSVDIGELQVVGRGKVSIESPLVVVDESSKHGHHGDASVLALNSTVTGEFLVISDVSKGIEETKRSGGTNLLFRDLKRGTGRSLTIHGEEQDKGEQGRNGFLMHKR